MFIYIYARLCIYIIPRVRWVWCSLSEIGEFCCIHLLRHSSEYVGGTRLCIYMIVAWTRTTIWVLCIYMPVCASMITCLENDVYKTPIDFNYFIVIYFTLCGWDIKEICLSFITLHWIICESYGFDQNDFFLYFGGSTSLVNSLVAVFCSLDPTLIVKCASILMFFVNSMALFYIKGHLVH